MQRMSRAVQVATAAERATLDEAMVDAKEFQQLPAAIQRLVQDLEARGEDSPPASAVEGV